MPGGRLAAFNPFTCPNCGAFYQVVKVEAGPETDNREITCCACSGPLVGREGKFVLKYFLLRQAISHHSKPASLSQSRRVSPNAPVGTSISRHIPLCAAHRPCGPRCLPLPLRVFGNAARYRRSVFARRRQVQGVPGLSTRSLDPESHELWPTRAIPPGR